MGGNIVIGDLRAQPVKITATNRWEFANRLNNSLIDLANGYFLTTGRRLFGEDNIALTKCYSGSTENLFDYGIEDYEFASFKPSLGDIDIKVGIDDLYPLTQYLHYQPTFGTFRVLAHKKFAELHTLVRDSSNDQIVQFDFEPVKTGANGLPLPFEMFAHSSAWEDVKIGIKGAHHKMLLNAVGLDRWKFSTIKGLMSRESDRLPPVTDLRDITRLLFGVDGKEVYLHSFQGIVYMIQQYRPVEEWGRIRLKFLRDLKPSTTAHPALEYIGRWLGGTPSS